MLNYISAISYKKYLKLFNNLSICKNLLKFNYLDNFVFRQDQRKRYKVERFVQDVVSRYSLDTFKTFFRVSKTKFDAKLENIQHIPELLLREPAAGRPHISHKKDLLMMPWYIGSQEPMRSIADQFIYLNRHSIPTTEGC